jgi:alkylation response protein AidB-like acyl-CoA dehydrogenase
MIKVQAPQMALRIIDDAVQAHGGAGVSQDFGLAASWAGIRTLRLADGPDEVHNRAIARIEFSKHAPAPADPMLRAAEAGQPSGAGVGAAQ